MLGTGLFAQLGAPANQKMTAANRYAAMQPRCRAEVAQQLQIVLGEEGVPRWADATIRGYAIDRYSDGGALRKVTALVDARSAVGVEKKHRALLDKLEDLELEIKGARARGEEVKADDRAVERWKMSNANLISQVVELKVSSRPQAQVSFCKFFIESSNLIMGSNAGASHSVEHLTCPQLAVASFRFRILRVFV